MPTAENPNAAAIDALQGCLEYRNHEIEELRHELERAERILKSAHSKLKESISIHDGIAAGIELLKAHP